MKDTLDAKLELRDKIWQRVGVGTKTRSFEKLCAISGRKLLLICVCKCNFTLEPVLKQILLCINLDCKLVNAIDIPLFTKFMLTESSCNLFG